ncbi:MAG: PadR family transcriptional regulator [Gemmatimonadaceae bacterium]
MALLKGTLDVLVLKALSWTPMHAFEVATWIETHSASQFIVEDAALMQALRRLEERGLLATEWGTTENARRAKYYRLTRAGRTHLREESQRLAEYANALAAMLAIRTAQG